MSDDWDDDALGSDVTNADRAFAARLKGRLAEEAERDRDEAIGQAFRALGAGRRRGTRAGWSRIAAIAAVAAAVAAFVTWVAMGGLAGDGGPIAAFDGGGGEARAGASEVRLDAAGRLEETVTDGERLVFRAGRLVRIEHVRGGVLDGVVVDLDGRGEVVRVETWRAGARVPPAGE